MKTRFALALLTLTSAMFAPNTWAQALNPQPQAPSATSVGLVAYAPKTQPFLPVPGPWLADPMKIDILAEHYRAKVESSGLQVLDQYLQKSPTAPTTVAQASLDAPLLARKIHGEVTNTSGAMINSFYVTFTLYNAQDQAIGNLIASGSGLPPGQTWVFDTPSTTLPFTRAAATILSVS